MKTKHIISLFAAAVMTAACSDSWDDHYPSQPSNGTEPLLSLIESNSQLSDFVRVAKATHLYNNMHITPVTYADLLASDQALTVWAPLNGTYNVDSLLDMCKTVKGDSLVGQQFMANHIAHNIYNMSSENNRSVKMLNNKMTQLHPMTFGTTSLVEGQYNEPATNGLLHVISKNAPFAYNIYEGLTCMPDFSHIGDFLLSYEEQKLDEDRSIVAGIENGEKIYSDSVMIRRNILFNQLDQISSEDSSFAMLVPTKEQWDKAFNEAKEHFKFDHLGKADSIQNYWANIVLLRDLIYNQNRQQSLTDSVFTTAYSVGNWPYHVFYKPFDEGGILSKNVIADSVPCSNGVYYRLAKWPFTREDLYYQYVKTETEYESNMTDYTQCNYNRRSARADSISGGYLDIVPKNSTSNWKIEFEVRGTLSATYDVCAVILPKQVYNEYSKDRKPNQFKATITYKDENNREKTERITEKLHNDPYRVDTVVLKRMTFPVASYRQLNSVVKVQLECSMTTKESSTYSKEMYLDCIYLRPVSDEDNSESPNQAMARKEDKK